MILKIFKTSSDFTYINIYHFDAVNAESTPINIVNRSYFGKIFSM